MISICILYTAYGRDGVLRKFLQADAFKVKLQLEQFKHRYDCGGVLRPQFLMIMSLTFTQLCEHLSSHPYRKHSSGNLRLEFQHPVKKLVNVSGNLMNKNHVFIMVFWHISFQCSIDSIFGRLFHSWKWMKWFELRGYILMKLLRSNVNETESSRCVKLS